MDPLLQVYLWGLLPNAAIARIIYNIWKNNDPDKTCDTVFSFLYLIFWPIGLSIGIIIISIPLITSVFNTLVKPIDIIQEAVETGKMLEVPKIFKKTERNKDTLPRVNGV